MVLRAVQKQIIKHLQKLNMRYPEPL
jgi:hypothetical protein